MLYTVNATYLLSRCPLEVFYFAVEANPVTNGWASNFPGVAVLKPDVWNLLLETLLQCLQGTHVSASNNDFVTMHAL